MDNEQRRLRKELKEVYPTWESTANVRHAIKTLGYQEFQERSGLNDTAMAALHYYIYYDLVRTKE